MLHLKKFTISAILILISVGFVQAQTSVKISSVRPGEVAGQGFSLSKDAEITVSGNWASFDDWDDVAYFYAWIINSKTRKVVWHQFDDFDRDDTGIHDFKVNVDLDAGNYEVYYSGSFDYDSNIDGLGDVLRNIFSRKSRYKRSYNDDLGIELKGPDGIFKAVSVENLADEYSKNSIVSIKRVGDYANIEEKFSVTKSTKVRIYAIGEGRHNSVYDYAWIYDPSAHRKVWEMDSRYGRYAGGSEKNQLYDEKITLPAGNYVVNYVTDDSHSYEKWNAMPPEDPQFWGITIFVDDKEDIANVGEFDETKVPDPVVSLTKVWDDEFLSQGFELKKDMKIKILALGEGFSKRLSDYGWIVDAETRETVWDMEKQGTEHAGGSRKNRMVEDEVYLDAGKYIVYYKTDDSHSYEDWNDSPPFLKDKWGITIWTVNIEDKKYVELFNERDYRNENVLAQIVRVREDDRVSKEFTLNEDTHIRIIAIGEGDRDEMYDYGWIENDDTGRIVWDMTYRKTVHAGGARKNRLFNDKIILPAGNYRVYFETDDSHSYREWNSQPPDNEEMYGITILMDE